MHVYILCVGYEYKVTLMLIRKIVSSYRLLSVPSSKTLYGTSQNHESMHSEFMSPLSVTLKWDCVSEFKAIERNAIQILQKTVPRDTFCQLNCVVLHAVKISKWDPIA